MTNAALERLRQAYDPASFAAAAEGVVEQLRAHLAAPGETVLPWQEPLDQVRDWEAFRAGAPHAPGALAEELIGRAQHTHHRRYMGHQVTPPLPSAALGELLAAFLNNSGAIYEMSPGPTGIEAVVVGWLARALGWSSSAGGFLTNGGTLGNLTALLAMRQVRAGRDVWEQGSFDGPRYAVLVNEQAHYSIERAVKIMGWGAGGVVPVATDASFSVTPAALRQALEQARGQGKTVLGVVANACSTATGSFDRLHEVADFCQAEGLWMHVDGAHGASACFSSTHRHLVDGIDRADSVVWDAHKMMMIPALVTAVLFRDQAHSFAAFAQSASYLLEGDPRDHWYDGAVRTLECTRQALAVKVFAAWMAHGEQLFGDYIDVTFGNARRLAALVNEADDFELGVAPQANIVSFRYTGRLGAELTERLGGELIAQLGGELAGECRDAVQRALRAAVCRSGAFYLVQADLPAGTFLRTTLMNPFTSVDDLRALLDALRQTALR
jgi:L-2,4-diaminobutyrate decarboxylase